MPVKFTLENCDPNEPCPFCGELGTFDVTMAEQQVRLCAGCITSIAARAANRNGGSPPARISKSRSKASRSENSPTEKPTTDSALPMAELVGEDRQPVKAS